MVKGTLELELDKVLLELYKNKSLGKLYHEMATKNLNSLRCDCLLNLNK
jgi:hypothetical protein